MAQQTALYDTHKALGATFTEFAGFDMPVHYGSIKEEHAAVRSAVGVFDVSHMGNLWLTDADEALGQCTPSDPSTLADGRARYTTILHDDGTILDDTIYGRYGDKLHLVPNAGMSTAVAEHLRARGATVKDLSTETAILAVQGPKAPAVLETLGLSIRPFRMERAELDGIDLGISGTGYTGEKGAELLFDARQAPTVWQRVMEAGAPHGIRPIGLGARDTLRLEKGYCLAGNEFAGGRTPLEAGLGWIVDWEHDFAARDALAAQKETDHEQLKALVQERGVPRHGYPVLRGGQAIGTVSSGTQSPTLGKGIALAYLRGAAIGDTVDVDVRGRPQPAQVVKLPFI